MKSCLLSDCVELKRWEKTQRIKQENSVRVITLRILYLAFYTWFTGHQSICCLSVHEINQSWNALLIISY